MFGTYRVDDVDCPGHPIWTDWQRGLSRL